jgi:hypothetical protein
MSIITPVTRRIEYLVKEPVARDALRVCVFVYSKTDFLDRVVRVITEFVLGIFGRSVWQTAVRALNRETAEETLKSLVERNCGNTRLKPDPSWGNSPPTGSNSHTPVRSKKPGPGTKLKRIRECPLEEAEGVGLVQGTGAALQTAKIFGPTVSSQKS